MGNLPKTHHWEIQSQDCKRGLLCFSAMRIFATLWRLVSCHSLSKYR